MKIKNMIEYVCAVCGKTYQTRKGLSNHINKLRHFEGHIERFSISKSERELKRINKNLKLQIAKTIKKYK